MVLQLLNNEFNVMLEGNEIEMPKKVLKTISFFKLNNLWYNLSRNKDAFRCEDAAKKRNRNGKAGIPLEDELKTFFGEYKVNKAKQQLVLINLPGNCQIDFPTVRKILRIKENITLAGRRNLDVFDIEFAEVNPFLIYQMFDTVKTENQFEGLIILFDKTFLNKESTVMTNAGELSWGIEFNASDVVKHFDNCIYDRSFISIKD